MSRGRIAAAAAVPFVSAVSAVAAVWFVVTPWSVPVWPLLAFVPVPLVVWWLSAGASRLTIAALAVVVVAVVVSTVGLTSSQRLGTARYGSTLDELEVIAVASLTNLPTSSEGCGPPPPVDYWVLGIPARVCVVAFELGITGTPVAVGASPNDDRGVGTSDNEVRQVRFDWDVGGGVPARQLVFEGGVAQPVADRCVRRLDGRWWAWQMVSGGCPRGFVSSTSG